MIGFSSRRCLVGCGLWLVALGSSGCGGSEEEGEGLSDAQASGDPAGSGTMPTAPLGGGGAGSSPEASGGAPPVLDENGCDPDTQVSCRGECFTAVGDEAAGCQLLRVGGNVFAFDVQHMIASEGDLYYSAGFGVSVLRLASLTDETLSGAPQYVNGMLLTDDSVYVTTQANDSGTIGPGTVQRVPRSGGEANALVTGAQGAGNPAVVGDTLFFTIGFGSAYSVPIDGSAEAMPLPIDASSLLADGTDLFFAEALVTNFPISVAPAGDFENPTELVVEAFDPELLTVHDGFLYYIDDDTSLSRVPRDGGTVEVLQEISGYVSHQGGELFTIATVDGNGIASVTPLAGGTPSEIAEFSDSVIGVTATATHFYVSVKGGAIFEVTR